MKYVVSDKLRPPPHCFYGDSYERGLDPWHRDAFVGVSPNIDPDAVGTGGPRKGGWMLIDGAGNAIGFVPDGEEIEVTPQKVREMPADLRDALMAAGADTAMETGMYDSRLAAQEGA